MSPDNVLDKMLAWATILLVTIPIILPLLIFLGTVFGVFGYIIFSVFFV